MLYDYVDIKNEEAQRAVDVLTEADIEAEVIDDDRIMVYIDSDYQRVLDKANIEWSLNR